ncbi:hypothetical protein Poli38472_006225 [Pythium oligandrum]|uniref:Uncharacterized protein n=1 Tax=Pythium oligandrum TaxID=41045 RepID=A0A8K1CTY5_PYTOL|nr:hypothetical protein Poli38472_006225 [Pythium oligandrum]|eukprot:TMW68757.1 hypothetical protein Poli38472_006225 [Pythium oligandrum]
MNPWGNDENEGDRGTHRVALGGLKAFVQRNQLDKRDDLFVDTSASSSIELMQGISRLMTLKEQTLERVRALEQMEREIGTGGVLLPRQLEARIHTVRSLRDDLNEVFDMKSVILRTLQKNVASEYLDIEMEQQRTFIDLFLKLSDELPRYTSTITGQSVAPVSAVAVQVRQRHKDYETIVMQVKAAVAKLQMMRDEMTRVRSAYASLQDSTTRSAAAYEG